MKPILFSLCILFSSVAFAQLPPTDQALETWTTMRGSNRNVGIQRTKGSYNSLPYKRWEFMVGQDGGTDSQPLIADVDGDGQNEAILCYTDSLSGQQRYTYIYVLDGATGNLEWSKVFPGANETTTPAIGDINGDGDMEIIMGLYFWKIVALEGATGNVIWEQPYVNEGSIVLAEIDGDGLPEVIFCGDDYIQVLDAASGTKEFDFTTITGNGGINRFGICDVDLNGDMEVAFNYFDNTEHFFAVMDVGTQSVLWTSDTMDYPMLATPAFDDVDGDGDVEVIFVDYVGDIYTYDAATGNLLWMYDAVGGTGNRSSVAIADLDLDGNKEVINANKRGDIVVVDGATGAELWKDTLDHVASWFSGSPKIGDFDQSSEGLEIIVSTSYDASSNRVYMFAANGELIWSRQEQNHCTEGVTVGDIDNDGCVEILVGPDITPGSTQMSKPSFYLLDDIDSASNCGTLPIDTLPIVQDTLPGDTSTGIWSFTARYAPQIFPNPAEAYVDVAFNDPLEAGVSLLLVDARGVIARSIHNVRDQHTRIDVNDLDRGLYILRVKADRRILSSQKLVLK